MKDTWLNLRKLDDHNTLMVFIGYKEGSKAYRMLESWSQRIQIPYDVLFNEDDSQEWEAQLPGDYHVDQVVNYIYILPPVPTSADPSAGASPPAHSPASAGAAALLSVAKARPTLFPSPSGVTRAPSSLPAPVGEI